MRILTLLLLSLFPALALAAPPQVDKYLSRCQVTPAVTPKDRYPGREEIVPSNKLALPAGKSALAKGQFVYITGRIFDENCVPVSDAIVDIWHTNPEGHYVASNLGDRMSPYPDFAGSGRAVTDNLGRYSFVTIFPGTYGHRAPHIHVHVIHKSFATLDTEMYFADDRRNAEDYKLKSLSSGARGRVMAKVWMRDAEKPDDGVNVMWDITLRGRDPWHHF